VDGVWFWVWIVAFVVFSFATATLYRHALVRGRRRRGWGRRVAVLVTVGELAALLWGASRHGWLLVALILYAIILVWTRIVAPWTNYVWSAPLAVLGLEDFAAAFVDRLVQRPGYAVRLECYSDFAALDCGYTWLGTAFGQNMVWFRYSGECVICAVQRGFEAVEAATAGALNGVADDFRRRYAETPRFTLAFKPRPPALEWYFGFRPSRPALLAAPPQDLCAEHQV
jgi:hypothetical protein